MMTVADLICKLLEFPPHHPVEVIVDDGSVVTITHVDRVGWGVRVHTADELTNSCELQSELDETRKAIGEQVAKAREVLDELSENYGDN